VELTRSGSPSLCAVFENNPGRMLGSAEKDEYFALVEGTRSRFAQLINAHADEVALTKNVSEGLNIVAAGMPWQAGDNVVLCPELEHPNNVYCWLNLRNRGVEVRLVSPRADRIPIDEMVGRIDARTRVVTAEVLRLGTCGEERVRR
jgi:cysteine desulfurase / selenocysteine lyase